MTHSNRFLAVLFCTLFAGLASSGCVVNSSGDGDGDGGDGDDVDAGDNGGPDASNNGLSAQCNSLCDRTPVASDFQGDCTAVTLSNEGGYSFLESSCTELAAAFDLGIATVEQCVACYLDAGVAAGHCTVAESTCF